MQLIRVAAVQMEHASGDKEANLSKIRGFVELAAAHGVEIITFPECCVTGYWFLRNLSQDELFALAEPIPDGPSSHALLDLARDFRMTVGAGLVERASDGALYNSFVVAMPNGKWHCHRKLHAFVSEHLSSGSEFTVFDTPHGGRVGVLICYDNNLGENVRVTALKGAEILLAPHQTGGCDTGDPHCMGRVDPRLWDRRATHPDAIEAEFRGPKGRDWLMRWLPTRAHDNGMFLLFANGVGRDDDEIRTGNAMILDPYGRVLVETGKADDDVVIADLDPALRTWNQGMRWIRARRPELYAPLTVPTGLERKTRVVRFGLERPVRPPI